MGEAQALATGLGTRAAAWPCSAATESGSQAGRPGSTSGRLKSGRASSFKPDKGARLLHSNVSRGPAVLWLWPPQ